MFKFLKKIKQFFWVLQRSDERTKKFWLKIFTVLAMMIVIFFWFVYINAYGLPSLVPASEKSQVKDSPPESISEVFRRGLNEIFSQVKNQLDLSKEILQKQIQKTNELVIENTTSTSTSSSSLSVTSTLNNVSSTTPSSTLNF
jgi:predicted PurR-regulated permease PerM